MLRFKGCEHGSRFKYDPEPEPTKGQLVWCSFCNCYREVLEATVSYRVNCLNCSLNRRYERGVKLNAERLIAEHRSKFPEHTLALMDGMRVSRLVEPDSDGVEPLPLGELPPY